MKNDDDMLRQNLAAIPGLDLESGLAVMRGNLRKYTQLLVLFAEGHGHHAEQIFEMALAKDHAGIGPVAHSLRGSASMLGATNVSDAAEAILSARHDNASADEIGPLCSVLAEELSRLVAGIRQAAAHLADTAESKPDMARLAEVLERLTGLLEHGDIAASYLVRTELGLLRGAFGSGADSLLSLVEAFDFERAEAELRELRSRSRVRPTEPA